MRRWKWAVLAVNVLALPSAAHAAAYVLGDSIGEGVQIASGLKGFAHISVHIRGPKALAQIAQTPPGSTVFIVLGTNDADGSIAHLEKSIDDIVQAAERKHLTMVWLGPHCVRRSFDSRARELDDILRTRLASTSVRYVSMRDARICSGAFHEPDGVHLTMKGYRYIWEKVRTAVGFTGGTTIALSTPKNSDGAPVETTGSIAAAAPVPVSSSETHAENTSMARRLVMEIHTPPTVPSAPLVWVKTRN
jgi:hypothetical protein